nr:uncharacterized protein LOC129268566 [Lytechinus pictus]
MEQLEPPSPLDLEARNLPQAWRLWREEFELFTELSVLGDDGKRGRELYKTLKLENANPSTGATTTTTEQVVTLQAVLDAFEKHCNPPKNETVDRYRFFTRQQAAGETLEQYITDLKVLASSCNFRDLHDSLLRDRIIGGIKDNAVRARLLRESDLTLDKAIQICRAAELSKERMTVFDKAQDVHAVRKAKVNGAKQKQIKCKFCERSHVLDKNKCPAFCKKCNKCQKDNHFASVCTSAKPAGKVRRDKKSVNAVDEEAEDVEEFFVDVIRAADDTDDWFVDLKVNSRKVSFKLDTGPSVTSYQNW